MKKTVYFYNINFTWRKNTKDFDALIVSKIVRENSLSCMVLYQGQHILLMTEVMRTWNNYYLSFSAENVFTFYIYL